MKSRKQKNNSAKGKGFARITSEDLEQGFAPTFDKSPTEYLERHKRNVGLSPGARVVIKWK